MSERALHGEAIAHPNLALIKYWGKRDRDLNLPSTGSISICLGAFTTRTSVQFNPGGGPDQVILNGEEADASTVARVGRFLDLIRMEAGVRHSAVVESENDFPTAAGLASSSSAFAALSVAACEAIQLQPSVEELCMLARRGSGSAARSIHGGFVEMRPGTRSDGTDTLTIPLQPESWWDLRVVVAVTAEGPKEIGSTEGMELTAATSPYYAPWLETSEADLDRARSAVAARDLDALGEAAEHSALKMHASCLAARPGIIYWRGGTVEAMRTVRRLRASGHQAYFTVDAGPHVKVLCTPKSAPAVEEALAEVPGVSQVTVSHIGGACRSVRAHVAEAGEESSS